MPARDSRKANPAAPSRSALRGKARHLFDAYEKARKEGGVGRKTRGGMAFISRERESHIRQAAHASSPARPQERSAGQLSVRAGALRAQPLRADVEKEKREAARGGALAPPVRKRMAAESEAATALEDIMDGDLGPKGRLPSGDPSLEEEAARALSKVAGKLAEQGGRPVPKSPLARASELSFLVEETRAGDTDLEKAKRVRAGRIAGAMASAGAAEYAPTYVGKIERQSEKEGRSPAVPYLGPHRPAHLANGKRGTAYQEVPAAARTYKKARQIETAYERSIRGIERAIESSAVESQRGAAGLLRAQSPGRKRSGLPPEGRAHFEEAKGKILKAQAARYLAKKERLPSAEVASEILAGKVEQAIQERSGGSPEHYYGTVLDLQQRREAERPESSLAPAGENAPAPRLPGESPSSPLAPEDRKIESGEHSGLHSVVQEAVLPAKVSARLQEKAQSKSRSAGPSAKRPAPVHIGK